MSKSFKNDHPLSKRIAESARVKDKYPDSVPTIVEKSSSSDIASLDKKKYLVPKDITMGQFTHIIRRRLKIDSSQAIFIFTGNTVVPNTMLFSEIQKNHEDEDGFVYLVYTSENTFGC